MMKKYALLLCLSLLAGGCVGKFTFIPPSPAKEIRNSVVIEKPLSQVWKNLISNLGKSSFAINNLDKDSGFINVSHSGNPEEYIDCGRISYLLPALVEKKWDFPAASEYEEYTSAPIPMVMHYHKRSMSLDSTITILVQELSPESTSIDLNVNYVVTKNENISQDSFNTAYGAGRLPSIQDSISFTTKSSATFQEGEHCLTTGALEHEVLELLTSNQ